MTRRWSTVVIVVLTVVVAAGFTAWRVRPGPDARAPEPAALEIPSDAPRFADLGEMIAASDLVVLAEVTAETDGRTLSDPVDPGRGVRTRLLELAVVEVLSGEAPPTLVLEEEASLADGTPVRVDGLAPTSPGTRGVFFLVAGGSEVNPHHALVGPQGRFLVDGDDLVASSPTALGRTWVEAGGPALADAVRRSTSDGG